MGLKSTVVSSIASTEDFNGLPSIRNYVLWVGNSLPKKRQEVFAELAKMLPQYKFVMAMNVGCQERFNNARDAAKEIDNLEFLGSIKPSETQKWFNGASLYLNTSIREGFPNTYLQACKGKTPIISLNVSPDDIISNYNLGYCIGWDEVKRQDECPIRLAKLLSPVVEIMLSDNSQRSKIGENCFNYVREHHSPAVVVSKLETLLR
jgi:glycosyltransferase involved in cell wall biosynthesis